MLGVRDFNMMFLTQLIGLSLLIGSSVQLPTRDSSSYVAGVVEYMVNRDTSLSAVERFERNTKNYIGIMESEEANDVDILVFPESTLNSRETPVIVPWESDDIDLCSDESFDQNLRDIACTAKGIEKYVVINLTMKRNCTEEHDREHEQRHHDEDHEECDSEWILYNTNVVFDRNGKVISIYRKYNLFGERNITQPASADLSTFDTDFDVTFGHFICFDLMFQTPALDLVDQGIQNFIFPTMWFSELPFLTAVQAQQNWAHSNNVNLLGAGANNPSVGSSGSGIYSGIRGALVATMTGEERTRLLVHEVPKIPGSSINSEANPYSGTDFENIFLKRDQLDVYTRKEIELPESISSPLSHDFTLCHTFHEELCCDFKIDVALQSVSVNSVSYTYIASVFNGIRTFDGFADGGIQACAVLACRNDDISSCGTRFSADETVENQVVFHNIEIKGTFPLENVHHMPSSLNLNVTPYPPTDFSYKELTNQKLPKDNIPTKNITMSLLAQKSDLFTFAIYARDFRLTSAGSKITSTITLLLTAFIFKYLLNK